MGCFGPDVNDRHGVVVYGCVVEGKAGWAQEYVVAMVGFVLPCFHEDGREGMDSCEKVVGDDHQEWEDGLSDRQEVVLSWLPFDGGEGVVGLLEEEGDGVRRHDLIVVFQDNESERFGVGWLIPRLCEGRERWRWQRGLSRPISYQRT